MNANLFRLVFSARLGAMVPVWEGARARRAGKGGQRGRAGKHAALFAGMAGVLLCVFSVHAELPMPCGGGVCGTSPISTLPFASSGRADFSSNGVSAIINQLDQRVVLNWQSFNIGAGNSVEFRQPDAGSAALNRIWQGSPSEILGNLKANGQLYLINQNGIIFGKDAQVNASSLVASALNISDDVFKNGGIYGESSGAKPVFTWEDGNGVEYSASFIRVDNGAKIASASGGVVMLLAPKVENRGSISTPDGQAVLAAGAKVYLSLLSDGEVKGLPAGSSLRGFAGLLVEVDPHASGLGGEVTNIGKIVAERGNITLAGLAVNQMGRVTATTSLRQKGSIMLLAADTKAAGSVKTNVPVGQRTGALLLGEGSVTEVLPELSDTTTNFDGQGFSPSTVDLIGKSIEMRENAEIVAPGGKVSLVARQDQMIPVPGESKIYMASGSRIDVSGTKNVDVLMERNFIEVELRGNELKDSPLQRDGALRGKKVWIDIRKGTPLADVSGYTSQVGRTVAERTAGGGEVSLVSAGDIVMRENAVIDVSAGGLRYRDGQGKTTQLVSQGRVYDIGDAPADIIYDGIASFTKESRKWGISSTWSAFGGAGAFGEDGSLSRFEPGYYEGKNAGSVTFLGRGLALDGTLTGKATAGVHQRSSGVLPLGGQFTLGDASQSGASTPDFLIPDVLFSIQKNPLPGDFTFDELKAKGLPESFRNRVTLSTGVLQSGGFNRIGVYSNGRIEVPKGVSISLTPGSWLGKDAEGKDKIETASLTLTGRKLDILGDIDVPAGKITLASKRTFEPDLLREAEDFRVNVGADTSITARGLWVNDSRWVTPVTGADPLLINGGSISLSAFSDVALSAGSVLDVSGGGWVKPNNRLQAGNAGTLSLASGSFANNRSDRLESTLYLDGDLYGYALSSGSTVGKGGTLSLSASSVKIGGAPSAVPGALSLAPGVFQSGGFKDYTITGMEGVTVSRGTLVAPLAESLVLTPDFVTRRSGADIGSFSQRQVLPQEQRAPGTLTLAAENSLWGAITVEEGAQVRTDPEGTIALNAGSQIGLFGTLEAPAGKISLDIKGYNPLEAFELNRFVWLGANSRLLAQGFARTQINNQGLIQGEVLRGGEISVSAAQEGYLVTEAGSVMDVSGVSAMLDIPQQSNASVSYRSDSIAGDAGVVNLATRNMLLDGTLKGVAAGEHARGGSLILSAPVMAVKEDGASLPLGLTPGQDIAAKMLEPAASALQGKSFVTARSVRDGGFDQLTLKSNTIEFEGDVSLALRRSITLDAPTIAAKENAKVDIAASYVSVGNSSIVKSASSGGDGTLGVNARLIDLEGNVALQGFGDVNLASTGDIRLKGLLQGSDFLARTLEGSLVTGGNLTLQADQIYPTTLSQFRLAVENNPAGSVTILGGGAPSAVLSAGGKLTVNAPNIVQQGVLKAPLGDIMLAAEDTLTLGGGSITSVSAEGQIIPFGKTDLNGSDYLYPLAAIDLRLDAPPEKRIQLNGKAITVADNAVLDVSGGGDLYAYEFIPGPGGSKDVLDAANAGDVFAILPGRAPEFAPYDHHYYQGDKGTKPGDSVYLSGVEGLPAGFYAMMPARYALLPGAFLVKPVSGYQDMSPDQAVKLTDGATVVSGYRAAVGLDGNILRDARTSGFAVRPGASARTQSEYLDTTASGFFSNSPGIQLPGDAGNLSIAATQSLTLNGVLKGDHAAGRNGSEVDITADKLAIVGAGADTSGLEGFMQLDAAGLNKFGASSLLLGGTRKRTEKGMEIRTDAQQVVVANSASSALRGPEVLLVAKDEIKVKAGSVVEGKGAVSGKPQDITIGFTIRDTDNDGAISEKDANRGDVNGDGVIDGQDNVDGNGALLRVASGEAVAITRESVDRTRGDLVVESGAVLRADKSMILDATRDNRSEGTLALGVGGTLSVGAQRISLGEAGDVREGLVFSNAQLAALNNLGSLTLRSYSEVDIYGGADFGSKALKNLSIEAAGFGGYQNAGQTATLRAETVSLSNPNNTASDAAEFLGTGKLHIDAQRIMLGKSKNAQSSGNTEVSFADVKGFAIKGFDGGVKLAAAQEIVAQGRGKLEVDGDLALESSRITAAGGVRQTITATGAVNITQPTVVANLEQATALAGRLDFVGKSINHQGRIDLPAGVVTMTANGADATDSITLAAGSQINTPGFVKRFDDVAAYAAGGSVTLVSEHGDVNINPGALVDVSGTAQSDAGRLAIRVAQGQANIDGTLKAAAGNTSRSGAFTLDAGKIADFSALNNTLNAAEFGEARNIRVRSGDIAVAQGDTIKAHQVSLVADDGRIDVKGTVDASGDTGGRIGLYAQKDVMLHKGGRLDARAMAADKKGGSVTLATSAGEIDLESGASIDVSGGGKGKGGTVLLRAPRLDTDNDQKDDNVAVNRRVGTEIAIPSASSVVIEGVKVYNAAAITAKGATVDGGNLNIGTPVDAGAAVAVAARTARKEVQDFVVTQTEALANPADIGKGVVGIVRDAGLDTVANKAAAAVSTAKPTDVDDKIVDAVKSAAKAQVLAGASPTDVGDAVRSAALNAGATVVNAGRFRTAAITAATANDKAAAQVGAAATAEAEKIALYSDTKGFAQNADAIKAGLGKSGDAGVHVRAGVEIRSPGNLALSADWDLYKWRFNGEPGVLTLRAQGDLKLDESISDGFNGVTTASTLQAGDSWSYRLVAGADQSSADPLALQLPGKDTVGIVNLASKTIIRTGNGTIDIAAARDVTLDSAESVIYTAGVPGLALNDFTPPRLGSDAPAVYPTAGGDIRVTAQGDIEAKQPSSQLITDWLFRQGSLNPDGTLATTPFANSNNRQPAWRPQFSQFKQGIGALGGGDISIAAGGDIDNLSAVIPTNGRLAGANRSIPDPSRLVVQGGGDLSVTAGGDIRSGIFYIGKGVGDIKAGGALGSARSAGSKPLYTLLALGEGSYNVESGGELAVQHVFNPTVVAQAASNFSLRKAQESYFFTYGADSKVAMTSLAGDVRFINDRVSTKIVFGRNSEEGAFNIYPGTLSASALQGGISLHGALALFPSPQGNLTLLAEKSIDLSSNISATINMSDVAPSRLPSSLQPHQNLNAVDLVSAATLDGLDYHDPAILHRNDAEPVRIYAQTGSIIGGNTQRFAVLPKRAILSAGVDIVNVSLAGQNLRDTDVTRLQAGRDVIFQVKRNALDGKIILSTGFEDLIMSGPGRVEVIAGRDVDLGGSSGIVTKGNLYNPFLPEQGASVLVYAGASAPADYAAFTARYIEPRGAATGGRDYVPELVSYMRGQSGDVGLTEGAALAQFKALPQESQAAFINRVFFAELRSSGRAAADEKGTEYRNYGRGRDLIATLFPVVEGSAGQPEGDIRLYFSQIKTEQGGDIDLLAPHGLVNAGLATAKGINKTAANLGIVSVRGGNVNAFVRDDFLVNQSRVFTMAGGDILVWSDKGNIDAGKGSKTASATPPPRLRLNKTTGKLFFDITDSVAGSGIGALLAKEGIRPGDVDLIAPEGEVNAGDAGIRAAGNLTLAALRVVGADNISVGGISTGVPVSDSGAFAGALSGVSNLGADTSKIAEKATQDLSASAANPVKNTFRPSFLTVEVIGFGD